MHFGKVPSLVHIQHRYFQFLIGSILKDLYAIMQPHFIYSTGIRIDKIELCDRFDLHRYSAFVDEISKNMRS